MPGSPAEAADWSREDKSFAAWSPSRSLLASIRMYQRHAQGSGPIRQAEMTVPERELVGSFGQWIGGFGVAKAGMRVMF